MESFGHYFIKITNMPYDERRICDICGLMSCFSNRYNKIFNNSDNYEYYIDPIDGGFGFYDGMDLLNISCDDYAIKSILE